MAKLQGHLNPAGYFIPSRAIDSCTLKKKELDLSDERILRLKDAYCEVALAASLLVCKDGFVNGKAFSNLSHAATLIHQVVVEGDK